MAYVYKLTHKETGEFYYGVRWANKVSSQEDLGIRYFSSSQKIKNKFAEFNYEVIKEFDDKHEAYRYEQELIREHWRHDKSLNRCLTIKETDSIYFKFLTREGHVSWNKGLTKQTSVLLNEVGKSISNAKKGKKLNLSKDEIHRRVMSMSGDKNLSHRKDVKEKKLRKSLGVPHPHTGVPCTTEKKEKIGRANSGNIVVKDKHGNMFTVKKTDDRYISGELIAIQKGKIVAKDRYGNYFSITKDDERWMSGELKGVNYKWE